MLRIACLQMNACAEIEQNLEYVDAQATLASQQGVQVLQLPENFAQMAVKPHQQVVESFAIKPKSENKIQFFLAETAKRCGLAIVAGSVPINDISNEEDASALGGSARNGSTRKGSTRNGSTRNGSSSSGTRAYARTLVYDAAGECVAHYDKLHLFDVSLPSGQRYQESASYRHGEISSINLTPVELFGIKFGLTICYDLRFPELYRRLRNEGARVFCVPSAFTYDTGKAHWETLLRSRAIENSAFVFAAAQTGVHASGRKTWGHSMIIDPWGSILATKDETPGLLIADIDINAALELEKNFPVMSHRRL